MALPSAMRVIAAIGDDEYLQKIANNIASFEDVSMIASSKYTTDIMELCERLSPDVLISDLSLDHESMNAIIRKLCRNASNRVKVITTASSKEGEAYMPQAIREGAQLFMQNLDNPRVRFTWSAAVKQKKLRSARPKPNYPESSANFSTN